MNRKFQFLKNRAVQNAGWLIGGRVIQMVISLFVGLLTARYLGPSNYGLTGYAAAYTAFFTAFCTLGINSLLVKEFVDHPGEEGKIIGTALGLRGVSSLLSSVLIVLIVLVLDAGESVTIWVVALTSLGLVFNIFETFNYWFQSKLESKVTAKATLIGYSVSAAYKVYLMIAGKSVVYFALVSSLDYLCLAVVLLREYRRHQGGKLTFSWTYGKSLLARSRHFILPSLMVAIYGQTDKLMLKQMISETEIGYYNTATTVCTMWCFVLAAIIDSVYPSIMEAHKQGTELFERRNRQLYAMVFYISAVVAIGFTILGKPVIYILYGRAYLPAVAPLRIVTWYTAFSYLGVARNAWIVCEEKQKYLFPIYLSAAASNVALNLLLIPRWGASGAALASLTAQIITTMVTPFFIKNIRRNSVLMLEAILLKGVR